MGLGQKRNHQTSLFSVVKYSSKIQARSPSRAYGARQRGTLHTTHRDRPHCFTSQHGSGFHTHPSRLPTYVTNYNICNNVRKFWLFPPLFTLGIRTSGWSRRAGSRFAATRPMVSLNGFRSERTEPGWAGARGPGHGLRCFFQMKYSKRSYTLQLYTVFYLSYSPAYT